MDLELDQRYYASSGDSIQQNYRALHWINPECTVWIVNTRPRISWVPRKLFHKDGAPYWTAPILPSIFRAQIEPAEACIGKKVGG